MGRLITIALPNDLPENWTDNQYVTPGGTEAGLTKQHGFNYLMTQVNNAQKAINELDNVAMSTDGGKMLNNITYDARDYNSAWARGILLTEGEVVRAGVGGHGDPGTVQRLFLGLGENPWQPDTGIIVESGHIQIKGVVYADEVVTTKVATAVVG